MAGLIVIVTGVVVVLGIIVYVALDARAERRLSLRARRDYERIQCDYGYRSGESDAEAIARDWRAVGNDLRRALGQEPE